MGKEDRKMVHCLANFLKMGSKSSGTGNNRYPCIYKTSRTLPLDRLEAAEEQIDRWVSPRPRAKGRGGRTGGSGAAVSYKDGEIIGGTAAEIGADNKGRAMLEKMGWTTGTGLGALNNKGSVQPIMLQMKATRVGLG
jgi:hypothetical protein